MGLQPGDPGYLQWSCQPMLYAIAWSFFSVTVLVFACRMFSRAYLIQRLQAYDYIMIVAFIDIVVMHAMLHLQVANGMGRVHEWVAPQREMTIRLMKVGYVQYIAYQSSLGLIKTSILVQYYTIASSYVHKRFIIGVLVFVILFSTYTTLSAILLCLPIPNVWNPDTFPEGCWNTAITNTVSTSVNMATDIAIYLLPIPILLKLNLPKRKKWGLVGVFSIAFVAIGGSLGRLTTLGAWNSNVDMVDGSMIPVWGAVEAECALIAVSLPLIKPLFKLIHKNTSSIHSFNWSWNWRTIQASSTGSQERKDSYGSDKSAQKDPHCPYPVHSVMVMSMDDDREKYSHGSHQMV